MRIPKPVVMDLETFGITGRPSYPPVPCGVSVQWPGRRPRYYAFGHLEENNCTWDEAHAVITAAYAHPDGVLFQNGKFDVDVIETHFGIPMPAWDKVHDSMFLLFLHDPNQTELGLKASASRLLGLLPEERDTVIDWLTTHQPVPHVRISASKQSPTYAMKYLPFAPGTLVGTYANGDTDRTDKLFKFLWPDIVTRKMQAAYDRERKLMPILLEMERQGVPVDVARLQADVITYRHWEQQITTWICARLKTTDLNLDSGDQLMAALIKARLIDETKVPRTKTGKLQFNKEALLSVLHDKVMLAMLKYRTQVNTCLQTFMEPWLATALASDGLIFTQWNQVKSPKGDSNIGTRTGRLSSTPNFQNMPKEFTAIFAHEESDRLKAKTMPKCPLNGLPSLPRVRSYITPFKGHILVDRDYSQQEPRILAHFDGGSLMKKYIENPWIDFHDYAKAELEKMGLYYARKPVKNTNLGLIYGMGVGKLALKNGMAVDEASKLKKAILILYPGLKEMYADMKVRAQQNIPVRTWGGREYYCEKPKLVDGRIREFDYKLVNVLIQGSAADCTKEAIIRFDGLKKALPRTHDWRPLFNVHDQITVSVPKAHGLVAMQVLKDAMESVEFDVPMLSEGSSSLTHWDALIDVDKKGVLCPQKP